MKKSETRALDMLKSVRLHGQTRAAAFPANSRGGELYASVNTRIGNIERLSGEQAEHERNFREASKRKNGAEDSLQELMVSINRTARSMSRTTPGVEEKFRLPPTRTARCGSRPPAPSPPPPSRSPTSSSGATRRPTS